MVLSQGFGAWAALWPRVDRRGRADARAAFFIGIDRIVLELVVEADVLHLLEDVALAARDIHDAAASAALAGFGLSGHALIMAGGLALHDAFSRFLLARLVV